MQCKPRRLTLSALVATLYLAPLAASLPAHTDEPFKISSLVKVPEQTWFINEQKVATELSQKSGFSAMNVGTPGGEEMLFAINNLGAQGAKGFMICASDIRLGPAISAHAKHYSMRFVAVDDRLVDSSGKPLANVPHLGMSAFKIGNQVGQTVSNEMRHRDWKPEEADTLRITNYKLPVAKLCTNGATQTLLADGFKKENIFDASQKTTNDAGSFNTASPVLAQHAGIKKWVVFALNEEGILGGVCTTEQLHIPAAGMIGVGINGADEAFAEFQKKEQTGLFGTATVSPTNHSKEGAANLVEWIETDEQLSANTQTTGKLMVHGNWQEVREELSI